MRTYKWNKYFGLELTHLQTSELFHILTQSCTYVLERGDHYRLPTIKASFHEVKLFSTPCY